MPESKLVPFCKLADPQTYVACSWNLTADADARKHWVDFFKRHLNTMLKLGIEAAADKANAQSRADSCRAEFYAIFDAYAANPQKHGVVTILD